MDFFNVLKYHNICFSLSYKNCVLVVYQYVQIIEKSLNYRKKINSPLSLQSPLPTCSSPSIYESK